MVARRAIQCRVLAFFDALKRGISSQQSGHLVCVTARPGLVKQRTHAMLRNLGTGPVTVMTGSMRKILTPGSIAEKKFENFWQYAMLFPGAFPKYPMITSHSALAYLCNNQQGRWRLKRCALVQD